jgi:hypothetical protein
MLLMVSFNERSMIDRVRAYRDSFQFWDEYEQFPEFRRRMEIEKPFFNLNCSYGQKLGQIGPFPMYFMPEGTWLNWQTMFTNYQAKKGEKK